MRKKVFKVISLVLAVDENDITDNSSQDTIQSWDSLKHIHLILALEQEFGVRFTDEMAQSINTAGDFADAVSLLTSPGSGAASTA